MPPSLWLGSGAAFGSAASPRNYPPAISTQAARAPAAPPPALRAECKSYSILDWENHPGALRPGPHTPMVCGSVSPGPLPWGPGKKKGFFPGKMLLPASAWSPFRNGSFLTPLLPSAGL